MRQDDTLKYPWPQCPRRAAHLVDRHPHHLSGGEKRRTAIATILGNGGDDVIYGGAGNDSLDGGNCWPISS